MKKKNTMKVASGDKYTYFVTSSRNNFFEIDKLHMCSWAYEDQSECLEIGVQFKLKGEWKNALKESEGHPYGLPIVFWLPWVNKGDEEKVEDLYPQISDKENAAFIFNDACPTATDCVEGKANEGQILKFSHRDSLTVLPIDVKIENKGQLLAKVKIPQKYNTKNDIYVRFCIELPQDAFCARQFAYSKEIRIYNINFGQIRNQPKELEVGQLCNIKDVFALHILPEAYLQTFTDPHMFRHIRILETDKYCRFAKGSKFLRDNIGSNKMIVSFSKSGLDKAEANKEHPFYSVFERDCMGGKLVRNSAILNIVCSIVAAVVTSLAGCFCGKKLAIKDAKIADGTNCCHLVKACEASAQK